MSYHFCKFLPMKGSKKMKKILALILVCLMSLSTTAFAAEFVDTEGHWAAASISTAAENGLITGSNGLFRPNDNMTRAEMATIMVRACGATADADISEFTDVTTNDWFYASVSKAVAMGAFNGSDGKFNPNNSITRQEAFVVLSRVFGLATNETVDTAILNQFADGGQVADWAKTDVAAIIASGYVGGSDGKLNPNANITRAEFAAVMDRLVKYYIDDPETTTIPTDGNVMIRVGGLKLNGVDTEKMVVIGDGVGDSEMSIANSHLDSVLVVRAGETVKIDGRYAHVKIIRPNIRVEGLIRSVGDSYDLEKVHKVYIAKNSVFASFNLGEPDESVDADVTEKIEETEDVEVTDPEEVVEVVDPAEETEPTEE